MSQQFERTKLLIGDEKLSIFSRSHVFIAGVGGVGSFVAEILVRSGIGTITIVDDDIIKVNNLNRQLPALHSTLGLNKTEVVKNRLLDINPQCKIITHQKLLHKDNLKELLTVSPDGSTPDFIVDAIDSLSCKIQLLAYAAKNNIQIISCMGAGRRTDWRKIKLAKLDETNNCPLASRTRKFLRKLIRDSYESTKPNISNIPVVYSDEIPTAFGSREIVSLGRDRVVNGTIAYIVSIMGSIAAAYVLEKLVPTST
ncbi:MAG: tRNA threonylcarbamoyladenosine dehydratase [Oligoflexia bacterium]|nr:tRNA threonylcarbamoyladenosine dehydratase [Oligoflexia bacterium]